MLKNKIVVRKIRNIIILLMAILIMIGAYKNIDKSKAEKVIEISAIAIDNYGCLENEEFILEAKEISDGMYEIEMPENINTKQVNQVLEVTIENKGENTEETENIEIIDNKIYLTTEQIDKKQINFETVYDVAITVIDEQGKYSKDLLSEMTEEEIAEVKTMTEGKGLLYNRTLKYEENGKTIEVKGYMLEDVELDIKKVTQEQLSEIYGNVEINLAYNIKTIRKIEKQGEGEQEATTETIEINPQEYGEIFEVSITDSNIQKNSDVYYLKDENTYKQLGVNENTAGNIKFNMYDSGIYAVKQQQLSFMTGSTTENIELGAEIENTSTETENIATGSDWGHAGSEGNAYARRFFTVVNGTWEHDANSYTSYVGVKKRLSFDDSYIYQYLDVKYVSWSTSKDTPTTWNTVDSLVNNNVGGSSNYNYFQVPGAGTWYLHVKIENGSTYYGGPYEFIQKDSSGAGVSAGVESSGTLNYEGTTINVKTSNGVSLTNSAVRARWVHINTVLPFNEKYFDNADTQEYYPGIPLKEATATVRKHSAGIPNSTYVRDEDGNIITDEEGNEILDHPEGLYYLQYKYWALTDTGGGAQTFGNSAPIEFDYQGPKLKVDAIYDGIEWNITPQHVFDTIGKWYNKNLTLSYSAIDGWSGAKKIEYSEDKIIWNTESDDSVSGTTGMMTSHMFTEERPLTKTYFRATDNAENVGKIYSFEIGIDKTNPTVSVDISSDSTYTKTKDIIITAVDALSGLNNETTYEYYLSKSSTALSGGSWKEYPNRQSITIGEGLTGEYYLFVRPVTDQAGNKSATSYHVFGPYNFDNTAPTKPIITSFHSEDGSNYTSGEWTKYLVESIISTTDEHSGIESIEYSIDGQNWDKYVITENEGETWTVNHQWELYDRDDSYYLKAVDKAGNESIISSMPDFNIRYDLTQPSSGTLNMKLEGPTGSDYINAEWTNKNVYIEVVVGNDQGSGPDTAIIDKIIKNGVTYKQNITSDTLTEEGTYTITVKTIDKAGNESASSETYIVKIDKTKPEWTYIGKDIYLTNTNDVGNTAENNDVYANADRTVVITFNGTDATSGYKSNTLNAENIKVYINGTQVITGLTKTLSSATSVAGGIQYTLTLKGITGDGILSVELPSSTLTDNAENTNEVKIFSTDLGITIDNTNPDLTLVVATPETGYYKAGQVITITATYNEEVYKEITSNTLITTANAPTMSLEFGGTAAKNPVTCTAASGGVLTYSYTIKGPTTVTGTDGDNGILKITSLETVYDAAGNGISATNVTPSVNITADTIAPIVTSITPNVTSPTNATSVTYTVVFSENVTGFTADDVIVNSEYGEITSVTGSGTTYLVVVSTTDNQEYTETITIKANGATIDKAGNKVAEAKTSDELIVDRIEPTWEYVSKDIYLTNPNDVGNTGENNDIYANADRTVVIVFKGTDVNGHNVTSSLTSDAIAVTVNGTVVPNSNKTLETANNGTSEVTCILTITGITGDGTLDVQIPSGTLTDQATNTNTLTNITTNVNITIDNISPELSLEVTSPEEGYYKAGQVITITATYNEDVYKEITSNTLITTTANAPAMTLTFGGATSKDIVSCTSVSGRVFTYSYTIKAPTTVTGTDGDNGTLVISSLETVYDGAGNAISASNVIPSVTIVADTIAPTVISITADQPVSPYTATNAESIIYTVTFSEAVTGFTASDVTVNSGFGTVTSVESSNGTGNDTTWTVVISTTDNQEYTETITVKANGGVIDRAGNKVPEAKTSDGIVVDRIDPTIISITPNVTSPTNVTSIIYTVVFSEKVTGFEPNDVIVNSGKGIVTSVTSSNGTGNDTTWEVVVSTTDDVEYTETITIKANGATIDKAGNKVAESKTSDELMVDRIDPTWEYVSKDIYLTNPNDVGNIGENNDIYANADRTVKITFKGTDVNGHNVTSSLTSDAIPVTVNGTAVPNSNKTLETANNGTSEVTCTLTITGITGDGTLDVQIPSGTLVDQATNTNTLTNITTNVNITIDNISPELSLEVTSPEEGYYKAGQVITITATYNEDIYKEITSNTLITTPVNAPAMSLEFGGIAAKNPVTCTSVSGRVFTYSYTIKGPTTPTGTNGDNGILVISSLAPVYDRAGNVIYASNVTPSPQITADTIAPTVISITADQPVSPYTATNAESIIYTVTFSEAVTGFTADDVIVNSGYGTVTAVTSSNGTGNDTIWTVVVETREDEEYTETITVKANGGVIDRAGNKVPEAKTSDGIVVDRIDPTIISITPNVTSPTNATSIIYTVVFSENVTAFEANDVIASSGYGEVISVTASNGTEQDTTWEVVLSTTDDVEYTETITIKANGAIIDKAGNKVTTAETSDELVVDRIDPTWTYVSKDIYLTNPNDVGNTGENNDIYANADRTVVIVFKGTDANGHNVTSTLTSDAISVTVNGTAVLNSNKTLETANNGTSEVTCTLTITGITGDGILDVQIPSGTLTDQATNINTLTNITTSVNITIDNTNPTVSFAVTSPAAGHYKEGQVITITAIYSENVYKERTSNTLITTPADAPTMSLEFGGIAAKNLVTCTSVSGRVFTYSYTIKGPTVVGGTDGDNGVLKITSLGTVYDAAGNSVSASNVTLSPQITADTIAPTLTISANKTSYTNASTIIYTFTFSENVIVFTADDVTVTNGTKGTFSAVSGTVYTLEVLTIDDTVYTENVSVAADKCIDIAGNGNIASDTLSIQVDRKDPTITVTPDKTTNATANNYQKSQSVTITVADEGAGLLPGNSYQYFLSNSSTSLEGGAWTGGEWTDYDHTGVIPITIGEGLTGDYYLFVRRVKDNVIDDVKNESTTAGNITAVDGCHMFGTYKFDNTNPYWEIGTSNIDYTNKKVTVDIIGKDAHSGYGANSLDIGDIEVWVEGTKITNVTKELSTATTVAEGIKYTLTLTNFEEVARQTGKNYKEWSGSTKIVIAANTLEDKLANQNTSDEYALGHIDLIDPEFTYQYSETVIDKTTKKLTVVFYAADKFLDSTNSGITLADFYNPNTDPADALTTKPVFSVDGVPININVTGNSLTPETLDSGKTIKYTLVVANLQANPSVEENNLNDGYTYSGIVSISIPEDKFKDSSNNGNESTTITVGTDELDGEPNPGIVGGVVVDVVDPVWKVNSVALDTGIIKLQAKDKYFDTVTIDEEDITVYVNGVPSTAIVKDITSTTPTDITDIVNGVENTVVGKEYTLKLSNITPSGGGYKIVTPTNLTELDESTRNGSYEYKYRSENGGNISIQIAAGTITDKSGNTSVQQKFDVGTVDVTSPEVYLVRKTQNVSANTETIVFNVTDRNYDYNDLVEKSEITLWFDNVQLDTLRNNSTLTYKEIWGVPEGTTTSVRLGHQYTLVIPNIAETVKQSGKDYLENSGTLKMTVSETAAKDMNGNTLNTSTTTITDFIDYLKPQMEQVIVTNPINTSNKTYTMSFKVIDKYLYNANVSDINMITEDEISIYVDGELASSITKTLTSTPITATMNKTVNGVVASGTYTIGHTYILVLDGFEQSTKQSGKDFMEWSGTVKAVIAQNATQDTTGNTLETDESKRTLTGEHVDFIKPVLEKVSSTSGINNETIIFNVMDKYLVDSNTNVISTNEIIVYVDGEAVTVDYTNSSSTGLNGVLTKVQNFTATVNGNTSHIVGQQYQLVLSGFEQASRNVKDYKDYSGTVSIELVQNAVADTKGNTLDITVAKRTVKGDYVDFIKPDLQYIHSSSDINTTNKTYTMTFEITDKYYTSGILQLSDLTILMQNGQRDGSGNEKIYNLQTELPTGSVVLTPTEITVDTNITDESTGNVEAVTGHIIGHRYTLTISNLEQLVIEDGDTTANYSGVITVEGTQNKIQDREENKNVTTKITSGINIVGGGESGSATPVDVVDPIWEKVTSSAQAKQPTDAVDENAGTGTATLKIQGTDTYLDVTDSANSYDDSTLTTDEIEVYINGVKNTTLTPTISTVTTLTETRNVYGSATTETVQYGVEYTITLTGWAQGANQVKIRILEDAIKDKTGNGNKETDFIVYNVLKKENSGAIPFLGGPVTSTRENVSNITFVSSTETVPATGWWDVSAQGDNSIKAWLSGTKIYIGSDDEIFANTNSSYLFFNIGATIGAEETAITNIDILNTASVINMSSMFNSCGTTGMTSLDLGPNFNTANVTDMSRMFQKCGTGNMITLNLRNNFNTSNVTSMTYMFAQCGYTAMTSLELGNNFDTSNVTDFSFMFDSCGETVMSSIDLGENFDTSSATNMAYMFEQCGMNELRKLDLGDKFDTSKVTNMEAMFSHCGLNNLIELDLGESFDTSNVTNMYWMFTAIGKNTLTSLDLGDKFDTSKVTNMERMFSEIGQYILTTLDLGDKFYTTNVTNMYYMFAACGLESMKTLDLGPAFTRIAGGNITNSSGNTVLAHDWMFANVGNSETVIYASETIYSDMKNFKLNATETEGILRYARGIINPIYRPEWEKVSSTLDKSAGNLTVVVKGSANKEFTNGGSYTGIYTSDVTSDLTANKITVYVDGELAEGIDASDITVSTASTSTNATTGKTEVQYTITISNIEQAVRFVGKNFKEWSGNVELQFAKGTLIDTYGSYIGEDGEGNSIVVKDVSKDASGNIIANQNLAVIDIDTAGTIENIVVEDTTKLTANTETTEANMFVDLIKPEFTYLASNTIIVGEETETVTIIFDVTDKYFASTTLSTLNASQITVQVDDYNVTELNNYLDTNNHKQLTKVQDITYTVNGVANTKIGERYQLVISGLDQGDAYKYSGYMTLGFATGVITDKSGNTSAATTITVGKGDVDGNPGQDTAGNGIVVDVVDPIWKLGDVTLDEGIIKLITKDKYFYTSTIDEDDITVYVNGIQSTVVEKDITSVTPIEIKETVNGVENTVVGREYTLKLTNIIPGEGGYTEFTPTNVAELNNTAGFKYRSENGGEIVLKIAAGVTTDKSGNKNNETTINVGNIDIARPEVYEVQKIQNASANTETIVFNVTDRNYDPSELIALNEITLWFDNIQLDALRNGATLTQKEIKFNIDGVTGKVLGHQYTLVIPNIAETVKQSGKDYLEYSGTLKMTIAETAAKDLKGNKLNTDTTTITDFIDYLKPQMEQVIVTNPINTSNKTYTMSFKVIDKYLYNSNVEDINMITGDEITVYVDGEVASSITKTLTSTPITATMNKTVNGVVASGIYTIGHTYTLVLGGFEQSTKQSGKDFMEWSGTVKAVIAQNATSDTTGNILDADETERTLIGEHVDFIKPVLEKVSSTPGTNNETIIFNVMDKYLADSNTNVISTNEITVYVDGEAVTVDYTNSSSTGLDGVLTKVQNFTHTVNGDASHIVGQQYQLVLSGFEQATRNAKDYKDYSGTVTMEIAPNAVSDTKGNELDSIVEKRTVKGDFVDFIKPELEYTHSSSDINHGTKTYTMTFDITDKYYDDQATGNILTLDDLTITIQSEDTVVHDLKALALQGKVNIAFSDAEKTATFNKTVGGTVETAPTSHVIGHTYTLTISNLDQLEIASGDTTVNYSGVITVVVAQDQISDTGPAGDGTTPNKNVETEIVSGVDVPGGSGTGTVVDVVSPLFDKISSSAYAFNPTNKTSSIGTITFKATDRYFVEGSGITENDIQVVVDGNVVSTGITKAFTDTEELTEDRIINGVILNDVQYGIQYTLQITGWAQNANQVKIRIPAEKLTDQYGNKNIVTDLIVYNCLELTSSEIGANSAFLDGNGLGETVAEGGSGPVTGIVRQNIQQVIFVDSLSGSRLSGVQKVWDVSAMSDGSIKAWTSQTSAPYTVYIGSDDEIFANQNSSYLFAHIGYGSATASQTIINIDTLNVRSVTNMASMFEGCGKTSMTTFSLGSNFNTSNVTNMSAMFKNFGQNNQATLTLGSQFITNEVTNMSSMFEGCGTSLMTTLNLGGNFNTAKVTNMDSMFKNCTPNLTSIDLGNQFDTRIVTDMGSMFEDFGTTSLTSLDLGNLFYTSEVTVTDMNNMFNGCGTTAMTVLDLGPAFTKISTEHSNFMKDCGTGTLIIYAPESIYENRTSLKINN